MINLELVKSILDDSLPDDYKTELSSKSVLIISLLKRAYYYIEEPRFGGNLAQPAILFGIADDLQNLREFILGEFGLNIFYTDHRGISAYSAGLSITIRLGLSLKGLSKEYNISLY